ncbi:MAG: NUDIX domain-containing protein [Caulobacteraceae bacterium]
MLMITTRETGRWVIPKGWPMPSKTDWDAAAAEAVEEAGAIGRIDSEPIGRFEYFKRRERHFDLVEVTVYRLSVEQQLEDWPERDERQVRWFPARAAAELVQEPGLAALLMALL